MEQRRKHDIGGGGTGYRRRQRQLRVASANGLPAELNWSPATTSTQPRSRKAEPPISVVRHTHQSAWSDGQEREKVQERVAGVGRAHTFVEGYNWERRVEQLCDEFNHISRV